MFLFNASIYIRASSNQPQIFKVKKTCTELPSSMKDESGVQAHKHTDATPLRGVASGVCVCELTIPGGATWKTNSVN